MVLNYQSETGPRLSCRFSMGDYNGRPSFLLKSQTGLIWNNLPPDLENYVKMPNMESAVRSFALGPRGLFWYTYESVNGVIEQKGSSNVWSVLAEDWKGGCPIRVSFGADGLFWGEKEWMTPADGQHLVQAFGKRPQSMIAMAATLHPTLKSFETNFVALGPKGSWIVGTQWGSPFWTGIPKALEDTIKRELKVGHTIVNIVLSPLRDDIYWIEYLDGTIDYLLPSEWDLDEINRRVVRHINAIVNRLPHDVPPSNPTTTTLQRLMPGNTLHDFVVKEFLGGWRHPTKFPAPSVHYVYEVILSNNLHYTYFDHLEKIERTRRHTLSGLPKGNQIFGWHGTRRLCGLGDDPVNKLNPCSSSACATCCILRTSFDLNQAGHAPNRTFLRFGKAIYTSSASSKSDDYQSSGRSPFSSLLLARVAKGKSKQMTRGDKTITVTPAGHDSVEGVVGVELNYDETCVYLKEAARPAFLVLYK